MPNDDQAAALAKMLAPLIAQHLASNPDLLKDAIRPAVESQVGGLKKKTEDLLGEVKSRKALDRQEGESLDDWFKRLEADSAAQAKELAEALAKVATAAKIGEKDVSRNTVDGKVYISRENARDPQAYRAAKARAEAEGRPLVVGSPEEYLDHSTRNIGKPSSRSPEVLTNSVDCRVTGTRFVKADVHKLGSPVLQAMAAERDGLKIRTFTDLASLPQHLHSQVELG